MNWLMMSIVASVVLTVVLNLALRLFPGAGDRATRSIERRMDAPANRWAAPDPADRADPSASYDPYEPYERYDDREAAARGSRTQVKVFFPWKAMLIGSLLLTLLLNVLPRL